MKPRPFQYRRASSVDEAVATLTTFDGEAKILAGGQSLVPLMNLRLAAPEALIDVNGIGGLDGIQVRGDELHLGALVRHRQLEMFSGPLGAFSLLRNAARYIGHYGVRDRGTFGGSIAHADPTAEWCLMAALFGGVVHLDATDFITGSMTTAARPDEMIVAVCLTRGASHASLHEYAQRHGDFAIVAAAVAWNLVDNRCQDVRVVVGGVAGRPHVSLGAAAAMEGREPGPLPISDAVAAVLSEIDPPDDLHASRGYRRDLAATLVCRALRDAASGVTEGRR
jgi:carbon-monoxide dehydrogenase medium subunit